MTRVDSSASLMHHDPSDLGSLILIILQEPTLTVLRNKAQVTLKPAVSPTEVHLKCLQNEKIITVYYRLFKVQKNSIFLFGIPFFVLVILMFLCYKN